MFCMVTFHINGMVILLLLFFSAFVHRKPFASSIFLFNFVVAMLRDSISKNGPYLTKEAYKYALERVRNYVPSSKEVG